METKKIKVLNILVCSVAAIIFAFVLFSVFFRGTITMVNNSLFGGLFAVVFLCLFVTYRQTKAFNFCDHIPTWVFILLSVLLYVLQIVIFYNIFFETGWDSGAYIVPAARELANGNKGILLNEYFSIYPNNCLMVELDAFILKLNSMLGIFKGEYDLMSIVCLNALFSTLATFLVYKILRTKTNGFLALMGFIGSAYMVSLSPWNVIIYSDSFMVLMPILMVSVYLSAIKPLIKYPLLFVMTVISYSIKPQTVMVMVAIVVYELFAMSFKDSKNVRKTLITLAVSVAVAVLTFVFLAAGHKRTGFVIDKEKSMPIWHFAYMGLNSDRGTFSSEDVEFSRSFTDKAERKAADIEGIKERLKEKGFAGYFKFLDVKLRFTYGDGTFAWSGEGNFYSKLKPEVSKLSGGLRGIYYDFGKRYGLFVNTSQFFWMGNLLLIFGGLVVAIIKKCGDKAYCLCALSVVALMVFEIVFEARGRYLFTFVPLFIVVAMQGMNFILENGQSKLS